MVERRGADEAAQREAGGGVMSLMPLPPQDVRCFVACLPHLCVCGRNVPYLPPMGEPFLPDHPPYLPPSPYLMKRMCSSCAAALQRGEPAVCGCYIPERDSPTC